jgi:hypothetical protein
MSNGRRIGIEESADMRGDVAEGKEVKVYRGEVIKDSRS